MEYKWIKHRTKTSASLGQWEYSFYALSEKGDMIDDTYDAYIHNILWEAWMDAAGFRGIDWEILEPKDVPKIEITKLLDSTMLQISHLEEYAGLLMDQT